MFRVTQTYVIGRARTYFSAEFISALLFCVPTLGGEVGGVGMCLQAKLITSRNGKCLMCSGEVIDIDLCCRGLWSGSIIAGSWQSQLCIIRLVRVHVCEHCGIFDSSPEWNPSNVIREG